MIGTIGVMPIEVEGLKGRLQNSQTEIPVGLEFCKGMLSDVKCVTVHCGPGKANAALRMRLMITHCQPRLVINSGVTGGIDESIYTGGLMTSTAVVQHDMDTSPLGSKRGYLSDIRPIDIPASEKPVQLLG